MFFPSSCIVLILKSIPNSEEESATWRPGRKPPRWPLLRPESEAKALTDGGDVAALETIIREPQEQAGLSDSSVSDYDELQQMIKGTRFCLHIY